MAELWNPRPRSIAVFRALQLGDMLCAVPALRALRRFQPQARIALVGLPWAASFAERYREYVDEFLPFPGHPGNPEREASLAETLDALLAARERRFDVAIQMHGSGETSNRIAALLGAARTAGFRPNDAAHPFRGPTFMPWPGHQPEIHRYLSLMAFLGVPLRGSELEMPLEPVDREGWQALARRHGLVRGGFVCIHPGARLRSRRWPAERFAQVAHALASDGWPVVVTGSPAEGDLARAVCATTTAIDLTGDTTLGSLAALIADSALLVCNDTGVSHVAAAVRARSVVVASGSDVRRWAPLDGDLHPVLWHDLPCRPCAHDACPVGHGCAQGVGVAQVIEKARRMLPERYPHAA